MNRSRLPLFAILALSLALGLFGLGFGLPNHDHAYPYNPDEWTPMQALQRMQPGQFDFNPHYFDNPTFHYYLWGGLFFAAGLAGFVRIMGSERFYFEHPEHLARMLGLGRFVSVLCGVLTVWLVYRLARRLGLSRGHSRLAALLMALQPALVIHQHFMTVNTAVTFWCAATLFLLERWIRKGGWKAAWPVAVTAGLGLSTKYTAGALLPMLLLGGFLRWRGTGRAVPAVLQVAGMSLLALLVFLAGSPYLVLAFPEVRQQLSVLLGPMLGHAAVPGLGVGDAPHRTHPSAGRIFLRLGRLFLFACTPPVLLAALGGLPGLLKRSTPAAWIALAWIGGWLAIAWKGGYLASDSRLLPLFPFLTLAAAAGLAAAMAWRRPAGLVAAALVVAGLVFWDITLLQRFVGPMPQQLASDWARRNLNGTERVHLAGTAIYWNPDLPLRERLQADNADSYARQTQWVFVEGDSYRVARAQAPEVVFLTVWLPRSPTAMEWLEDPAYEVVAEFPGKVRLFGRRLRVPLDLYDIDIWALRRRSAPTSGQ